MTESKSWGESSPASFEGGEMGTFRPLDASTNSREKMRTLDEEAMRKYARDLMAREADLGVARLRPDVTKSDPDSIRNLFEHGNGD